MNIIKKLKRKIAILLEEKKHIGRYALECIYEWNGNQEQQYEIKLMISMLSCCKDVDFKDCLDTIFYYSQRFENIDVDRIRNFIVGVFKNVQRNSGEKTFDEDTKELKLFDDDIELYESFLAYFFNKYNVDTLFSSDTLKKLMHFPFFKEHSDDTRFLLNEVIDFFTHKVDLSQKESQMLFYETVRDIRYDLNIDNEGTLETIDELLKYSNYLDISVKQCLLQEYRYCIIDYKIQNKDVTGLYEQFMNNVIMALMTNDEQLTSSDIIEIIELLNVDSREEIRENNLHKKPSEYALFVLTILAKSEFASKINVSDQIQLISSTRNTYIIKFYMDIMKQTLPHSFFEIYNANLAMAIIETEDSNFILDEFQKGQINFDSFNAIIFQIQNLSQDEIISKLNSNKKIDSLETVELLKKLDDKELAKSYIEMMDLSPDIMAKAILSIDDEEYIEEYINKHENIDIHLKYILAQKLSNKRIINDITSQMAVISDLSQIDLDMLIQHEECKYIQIKDDDRDVNHILGTYEIYTREQMIRILQSVEELLKNVPMSTGGDIIEDTITFKKIYEEYIRRTEYDDEAVEEEMNNDWRRQIKCRNFVGGLLDGLVVCSGDSFCLKNLLAKRGVKAYKTGGSSRYITEAGHAWNTIKLGDNFYKFDGTAAREKTKENGYLDLKEIKKEHGRDDDYSDIYKVSQSYSAIFDESASRIGMKKYSQEWD